MWGPAVQRPLDVEILAVQRPSRAGSPAVQRPLQMRLAGDLHGTGRGAAARRPEASRPEPPALGGSGEGGTNARRDAERIVQVDPCHAHHFVPGLADPVFTDLLLKQPIPRISLVEVDPVLEHAVELDHRAFGPEDEIAATDESSVPVMEGALRLRLGQTLQ